ncbi:complement C1q subcomponent subunit B-like [Mytilus galloprovincialis]|uniref:complement C1q subcomponent subunit B-like n=1 Tax=Mytilus galloprovincialis TaxID=29158 RepID=UPI003F7B7156
MFRTTVTVFMLGILVGKVKSVCDSELQNGLFQDLLNMMMKIKGSSPELSTCKCQKSVPAIAFTASLSATKSIGPLETVKFDKVSTNAGKGYNPYSGIFTTPKNGYYQLIATATSYQGNKFYANLWKNNEKTVGLYAGPGQITDSASIVLKLKKGDHVFLKHHNSSEKIYSDAQHWSMFPGFLISE